MLRALLVFGAACLIIAGGNSDPAAAAVAAEPLFSAVRDNRISEIERLLSSGANVNARDAVGNTALLVASWSGHVDMASLLLAHGADPNLRQIQTGWTPLHAALVSDTSTSPEGRAQIVRLLLAHNARSDFRFDHGETDLHVAAGRGDSDCVALLIHARASVLATDDRDNTPLDQAVMHDRTSVVQFLLANGADPNRLHSDDGRGPLDEASKRADAATVQVLLTAGAAPLTRDRFGMLPVEIALAYRNRPVVNVLVRWMQTHSSPELAGVVQRTVLRGESATLAMLLDAGVDPNQRIVGESTCLQEAALHGKVSVARVLVEHGAGIQVRDAHGSTPLHEAALGGNPDVIRFLLEHGASIDGRDIDNGATALMLAASLDRSAAVAVLIERGADPGLRDHTGRTALDRAQETGDEALIALLRSAVGQDKRRPRVMPGS